MDKIVHLNRSVKSWFEFTAQDILKSTSDGAVPLIAINCHKLAKLCDNCSTLEYDHQAAAQLQRSIDLYKQKLFEQERSLMTRVELEREVQSLKNKLSALGFDDVRVPQKHELEETKQNIIESLLQVYDCSCPSVCSVRLQQVTVHNDNVECNSNPIPNIFNGHTLYAVMMFDPIFFISHFVNADVSSIYSAYKNAACFLLNCTLIPNRPCVACYLPMNIQLVHGKCKK